MNLQDILLKKEELPIEDENMFFVPIHPRLLDPEISLDSYIAKRVFPKAAEEWYKDLGEYAKSPELKEDTREWLQDVFLKEKPKIKLEYGKQVLNTIGWHDDVRIDDNGFASMFSINRNAGGSLYFNREELGCETFVPFEHGRFIKFSKEKLKEFAVEVREEPGLDGAKLRIYSQHNVDYYPGALFLRNWAIEYMNEALTQIF